mgnify:CR=1 FL=1
MDITSFLKTGRFKDLSVVMSYSNFQKLKQFKHSSKWFFYFLEGIRNWF